MKAFEPAQLGCQLYGRITGLVLRLYQTSGDWELQLEPSRQGGDVVSEHTHMQDSVSDAVDAVR